MLNRPKAIFYCGTNGAGKSTLRGFNRDLVQIVIDSDHIAMELSPSNPRLADIEAGRKAIELFKFAINNQISFSMESTLSGKSILQRMKQAKLAGFEVCLNYVGLIDVGLNIARVKARVKSGGHFIDESTIRKRYQISLDNLIYAVELADESYIYDNSQESPNLMFHIEQHQIYFSDAPLVNWGKKVIEKLQQIGISE